MMLQNYEWDLSFTFFPHQEHIIKIWTLKFGASFFQFIGFNKQLIFHDQEHSTIFSIDSYIS